jgi:hypothetical protein
MRLKLTAHRAALDTKSRADAKHRPGCEEAG